LDRNEGIQEPETCLPLLTRPNSHPAGGECQKIAKRSPISALSAQSIQLINLGLNLSP